MARQRSNGRSTTSIRNSRSSKPAAGAGSGNTTLPGRRGRIHGVRFDFPEQCTLARTLALPTVSSWMATMPPATARAMRAATVAGASELARRPRSRRALMWALTREARGNDECGVIVEATWPGGRKAKATLMTRNQSRLIARATSLMVRPLIEGELPPGVHHSEEVLDPDRILEGLTGLDPGLAISFDPPPPQRVG